MIPVDKAVIAKMSKFGKNFEIWVDPREAREWKNNSENSYEDAIAVREVFSDAKKGKRATEGDLVKTFGTTDFREILLKILKHGEIQLTTEQKHEMTTQKKKQIVAIIAKAGVDPRTKIPHPVERIERMMEEHKIHIDPSKSAQEQIQAVLEKLRIYLPISMETKKIKVHLTAQDASRKYGVLKAYNISNEQWNSDGSLECICEMPAGLVAEFYDKINKGATGQVETQEMK